MSKKLQFLGPKPELTDPLRARAVILPIPLEKTTSYLKGTALGPEAIVDASHQVEFFDRELACEPCELGIYTDWELAGPDLNEHPTEKALERIGNRVDYWLAKEKFVLALGGEHTLTVGAVTPFLERYKDSLTVVQIDAHADLRDEYEGNPYSHACAMRRLLGRVPIVSVGIRSIDLAEYELSRSHGGVRLFYAHEMRKNPGWIQEVAAAVRTPHVYLTVDVDGLDPSVIPSTGTPEPGGLSWWEILDLAKTLAERFAIVGADIVELCPGPAHYAEYTAAKLAYKILGYSLILRPKS
ncbi:MAG: agmatinase [Pseudomonadota bacterium]